MKKIHNYRNVFIVFYFVESPTTTCAGNLKPFSSLNYFPKMKQGLIVIIFYIFKGTWNSFERLIRLLPMHFDPRFQLHLILTQFFFLNIATYGSLYFCCCTWFTFFFFFYKEASRNFHIKNTTFFKWRVSIILS